MSTQGNIVLGHKSIGVLATISLVVASLAGVATPAAATTASTPTIIFSGNTLASTLPATETANRIGDTLALSTGSLARTAATTRAGYSFGGWSLTAGGPATNEITTTTTADTTRTIHAVWNTTINYNLNGADSGTLSTSRTSDTYRFGQNLTLPTAGTLAKSGFAFGGWMNSSVSTTRFTSYLAGITDTGDRTFFAAWIKTVTFNANGATVGSTPSAMVYVNGGPRLVLPVASEMTLRKPGYEFVGWSTTPAGKITSNPTSYVPLVAQRTLYAIWKIQTTKSTARVFFNPGKSTLRAAQKLVLRDLVDTLQGRTAIQLSLAANRSSSAPKSLGKKRNTVVVQYLRSLGVSATVSRTNTVGKGATSVSPKNNRVTVKASWTNPTN